MVFIWKQIRSILPSYNFCRTFKSSDLGISYRKSREYLLWTIFWRHTLSFRLRLNRKSGGLWLMALFGVPCDNFHFRQSNVVQNILAPVFCSKCVFVLWIKMIIHQNWVFISENERYCGRNKAFGPRAFDPNCFKRHLNNYELKY